MQYKKPVLSSRQEQMEVLMQLSRLCLPALLKQKERQIAIIMTMIIAKDIPADTETAINKELRSPQLWRSHGGTNDWQEGNYCSGIFRQTVRIVKREE